MSVTKDSKNKKKKVPPSWYIAKAIPNGMIQVGTADDGTKIYSASAQIVQQYFPELYKLKPGQTNYIFTGKNGKYTPVRQSDDSYDKFINKDLLRTKNQNTQKEQKEQEVTTYSNNTPAANPYNVDDVTLKEQQKKLDWFDHGRQQWLDEQDAKVRKTAPSNHPWQLAFGTVLPAAIASSFVTAPLATTAGFIAFPYASQVFNDIWSNMNRPQPISGMNMAYIDGKYVDLGNFTPHQLLPKEARGKTWDEQVSSGLQKLGMSKENADAIAPFSNLGGIVGAGFASNAARPVDAAITNLARSRGYSFTPTRYNFRPTGGMTKGNTTTMYPATPDYNINYTTSSTFNPKYVFSKIGETNREGLLGGISSLKPTEAMQFGEDLVFNYLGSNRHINQIMKSGVSRQEATKIANQLYTNATRARGELVDPKALIKPTDMGSYDRNLVYDRHLGLIYDPKYKVANDLYNEDIATTVSHELGGHGATYSIIGETIPKEELPVVKRYFPAYKQIAEHNIKLKPQRKPEYVNGASDTETEKLIKYLEDPEEYTAVARSYHITDSPATLDDLYEFFTKESVDNLVNNVWSEVGDINKEGVTSAVASNSTKSKITKPIITLIDRLKKSDWYNFYFGKNEPITINITEPGANTVTTQINKRWPLRTKVKRASSLLRYKQPGTTLTIDGLPGEMVITEMPNWLMNLSKETLLPRIKKLNPKDYGRSAYMIDKMKRVVLMDKDLMKASANDISGFATVSPKLPNYFPIGIVKSNGLINKPVRFNTWIHELRHKLEHMVKLNPNQVELLKKAYKGIPKGERQAVNTELRTNLLAGMEDVPPELQDMFLDKYVNNPEVVMDKLEFLNGYGQNYVWNLYKNSPKPKKITQTVQDMINAMKYVPLVEPSDKVLEAIPTLNSNKNQ